jgi:hypothetical protein
MNKKAQFYIFTAIMLIGYSTLLLNSLNVVPDISRNFRRVYDNFAFESGMCLNNALFEGTDVPLEFSRFLDSFISYSRTKKLDVEVFAVLMHGENVYFMNMMDNPVHIISMNWTVLPGNQTYFLRQNLSEAVLEVRDDVFHENIYKLNISKEGTGAKAVLRVKKGSKRQIYVKE